MVFCTIPLHSWSSAYMLESNFFNWIGLESAQLIYAFRFFYYTAGSGGAGPTILATSFLLLGENVIAYNKGWYTNAHILFLDYEKINNWDGWLLK